MLFHRLFFRLVLVCGHAELKGQRSPMSPPIPHVSVLLQRGASVITSGHARTWCHGGGHSSSGAPLAWHTVWVCVCRAVSQDTVATVPPSSHQRWRPQVFSPCPWSHLLPASRGSTHVAYTWPPWLLALSSMHWHPPHPVSSRLVAYFFLFH